MEDQERARDAAQLSVEGHSWDEIAEACGYFDRSTAHRAVERFWAAYPAPNAEEVRSLQLRRAEAQLQAHWPASVGLNPDGTRRKGGASTFASDRVFAAMDRIARWTGTDGPPPKDPGQSTGSATHDESVSPRTLADLLGTDSVAAARVARVLHDSGVLPTRCDQTPTVVDPDGEP